MGDLILYQNLILRWLVIRNVETVFSTCLKIGATLQSFQDFGSHSGYYYDLHLLAA